MASPRPRLTHCYRGHEMTPENTRVFVHSDGGVRHMCIACRRLRENQLERKSEVRARPWPKKQRRPYDPDEVLINRLAAGHSQERGSNKERWAAIEKCLTAGLTMSETARRVGVCRRTVERQAAKRRNA